MASPHASSFICLPFGNETQVVEAYTVYFSVCLSSAVVGVIGATLFLFQVVRGEPYVGLSRSQRCILVFLAVSDLFADVGEPGVGMGEGRGAGAPRRDPIREEA